MRIPVLLALQSIAALAAAGAEDLLVSTMGTHGTTDGRISIEATAVSPAKLAFRIHHKGKEGHGWNGPKDAIAVAPGKWAFCISESRDVWFYDGDTLFMLYEIRERSITVTDSCTVPRLGEQAPEALKVWVVGREAARVEGR